MSIGDYLDDLRDRLAHQVERLSKQIAASFNLTFQSPEWSALAERLAGMQMPAPGDFVTRDAEATTPAEEEVLSQTADELAAAGVKPADLDRFAVLVFLLRMMAFGGVAAGGFVTGGAGWLASLGALERFLSEIAKLRERVVQRTES